MSLQRGTPRKLDENALWEYALRLLGARSYAESELGAKLRRRAARAADVERVCRRLAEYGYLDDRKFAEAFASFRLENQGMGRARVLRDLRAKKVPAEIAEAAVERVFAPTDEVKLIEAYLQRKFRRTSLPEYLAEPKHLAAAYRRLRYAGFSAANSIRVLKRYSEQAERLGELDGEQE